MKIHFFQLRWALYKWHSSFPGIKRIDEPFGYVMTRTGGRGLEQNSPQFHSPLIGRRRIDWRVYWCAFRWLMSRTSPSIPHINRTHSFILKYTVLATQLMQLAQWLTKLTVNQNSWQEFSVRIQLRCCIAS